MRVLVTGARGFVGRLLIPRLMERFPATTVLPDIGEITDASAVDAAIAQYQPDACIHLAAISAIGNAENDQNRTWDVNLNGTRFLADAILRHVPHAIFVFASTAEAYGATFQSGLPLDETALLSPSNTYAATKAAADIALGAYARRGLKAMRMRAFNHTGPHQSETFVTPSFAGQIARIALGKQVPEIKVGNLGAERDFLDARDVCDAYLDVIEQRDRIEPGEIFNICSGAPRTIQSILDDLISLSGVRARIVSDPTRLRPSDIPRAWGDNSKALRVLGWSPKTPWRTTLTDVYHATLEREGKTG